jgi:predicted peptidase
MLDRFGCALLLLVVAGSGCSAPAAPETGFLDRVVVVDGAEHRYQVYVPRDYRESEQWPVILSLHGGGARGADGIRPTNSGLARAIRRYPDRYPAIVAFPQAPALDAGWQDLAGRVALAALDATLDEFSTEPSRVFLTGYSMGGNGSWYQMYHHAERLPQHS